MSKEQKKKAETGRKKGVFAFLNSTTGRIGQIAAFLAAVSALLVGGQELYQKFTANGKKGTRPCYQNIDLVLPAKVKTSEWDSMPMTLKGSGGDDTAGLYVIFDSFSSCLRLKPPIAMSGQDCVGRPRLPQCWDGKKPVHSKTNGWEWQLTPPQLEWVGNPRHIEKFPIRWEVRDYDNPETVICADKEVIELIHDPGGRP